MKTLLVSATKEEISVSNLTHLVTGVGMVSTAIAVTKALSDTNYDLVINAGIAGSFNRSLNIGQVVEVTRDYFSEIGAQYGVHFLTPGEMGLCAITDLQTHAITHLEKVSGITVNTVHGDEISIQKVVHRFNPQIESMEGAACMLACQQAGVPCVQIRAISNYVEKRNKANWNIPLAIRNLNQELTKIISSI